MLKDIVGRYGSHSGLARLDEGYTGCCNLTYRSNRSLHIKIIQTIKPKCSISKLSCCSYANIVTYWWSL